MCSNQLRRREFNPPPYVTPLCIGKLNVSTSGLNSNHNHSHWCFITGRELIVAYLPFDLATLLGTSASAWYQS